MGEQVLERQRLLAEFGRVYGELKGSEVFNLAEDDWQDSDEGLQRAVILTLAIPIQLQS